MPPRPSDAERGAVPVGESRFTPAQLYAAARLYYDEEATQAEVAAKLGTSRATVSRLLSEARRQGIVRIHVIPPVNGPHGVLAEQVAAALGLDRVHLSAPLPSPIAGQPVESALGSILAPAVGRALVGVDLVAGDILLVSSGRTVYEVSRCALPILPGVVVAPVVGGQDQPEEWFQTNEITRRVAAAVGGRATYLFAPALPGPELYATLRADPTIQRVLHLWPRARCVLMGVGAPPTLRRGLPQFVAQSAESLRAAVGDVCARFYDREGRPVPFPGGESLMAIELDQLRRVPVSIAVACGADKVAPIVAGARARFFNQLVTDPVTAEQILAVSQ